MIRDILEAGQCQSYLIDRNNGGIAIVQLSILHLKVVISRRADLKGARSETRVRSMGLAGMVKRGGSSSTTSFPAKFDASWLESRRYRDNWMARVLLALPQSLRDYDKPQEQPLMVSLAIAGIYILDSSLSSMVHRISFHRRCYHFCGNTHAVARRGAIVDPFCDANLDRTTLRVWFLNVLWQRSKYVYVYLMSY